MPVQSVERLLLSLMVWCQPLTLITSVLLLLFLLPRRVPFILSRLNIRRPSVLLATLGLVMVILLLLRVYGDVMSWAVVMTSFPQMRSRTVGLFRNGLSGSFGMTGILVRGVVFIPVTFSGRRLIRVTWGRWFRRCKPVVLILMVRPILVVCPSQKVSLIG